MNVDWFVDRAEDSGLKFTSRQRHVGQVLLRRDHGAGRGAVRLRQRRRSRRLSRAGRSARARRLWTHARPSASGAGRLFRNDLRSNADGTRTLRFTDVTEASGIDARGYGMGVAAGDFDNDGWVDLYLTNLGPNQLFRNNCDGTFTDVSKQSRTDDPAWSVSACVPRLRPRRLARPVRRQLSELARRSQHAVLHALGTARLLLAATSTSRSRAGCIATIATARSPTSPPPSGIAREFGPALGVSTADFNGDGWIDIYVANDGQPNQLWINQRNGTFRNTGLLSGAALSADGKAKASMGVDAGDFDNDGDEDLFVTNLTGEGNDLYVNDGSGLFEEQSARSGLGAASRGYTGFGTAWFDFDNDGWLDILTVNGAVQTIEALQARQRSVSAAPAKAAVPQSRQRHGSRTSPRAAARRSSCRKSAAARRSATSTTTATWTCSSPTTTAAAAARQQHRQPESLDRAAARGRAQVRPRPARHARRARRDRARRMARRSGAAFDRMAAMRRRTIRECSSVSASQRAFREFG